MPRRLSRPRYTLLRGAPAGLPQRAGGAASAGHGVAAGGGRGGMRGWGAAEKAVYISYPFTFRNLLPRLAHVLLG